MQAPTAQAEPAPPPHGPPYRDTAEGGWIVTRHADALRVLKAPEVRVMEGDAQLARFAARLGKPFDALRTVFAGTLLLQNPPDHGASRALLRGMIAGMQGRWSPAAVQARVDALLAPLATGGTFDLMPALAEALPIALVAEALGLSPVQVRQIRDSAAEASDAWRVRPVRELVALEQAARETLQLLDTTGLTAPGCPVFAGREPLRDAVRPELLPGALLFFVMSGIETTAAFVGNALHLLASAPGLQQQLREAPGGMADFVEEALRFCGPVRRLTPRVLANDMACDGVRVPAGEPVSIRLDRVHRDPTVFAAPDRFDPARSQAGAIPFIQGAHACLGAPLARLEARLLLASVVQRFRLHPSAAPRLRPRIDFQQFASLPLTLEPL